jgi:DNA-binding NarL/FixJ family response regulator
LGGRHHLPSTIHGYLEKFSPNKTAPTIHDKWKQSKISGLHIKKADNRGICLIHIYNQKLMRTFCPRTSAQILMGPVRKNGRGDANLVEPTTVYREVPAQWGKTKFSVNQIRTLHLEKGMTTREISAALGISKTTVIERLHSIGIKRAPKK